MSALDWATALGEQIGRGILAGLMDAARARPAVAEPPPPPRRYRPRPVARCGGDNTVDVSRVPVAAPAPPPLRVVQPPPLPPEALAQHPVIEPPSGAPEAGGPVAEPVPPADGDAEAEEPAREQAGTPPSCAVDGCDRRAHRRCGLCDKHEARRRLGLEVNVPLVPRRPAVPPAPRPPPAPETAAPPSGRCGWGEYACPRRPVEGGLCTRHRGAKRRRDKCDAFHAARAAGLIRPEPCAPEPSRRLEPAEAAYRAEPESFEQRFWQRVSPEPNTGCWLWTGAVTTGVNPLPRAVIDYKPRAFSGSAPIFEPAQRTAWRIERGEEPPEKLYRLCQLRGCVNPAHHDIEPRIVREEPVPQRPHHSAKPVTWTVPSTGEQQALVTRWMPWARAQAGKVLRRNRDLVVHRNELEQAAYLGLTIAASRFDASRGVSFPSYATHQVRAEMHQAAARVLNPTSGCPKGGLPWRVETTTIDELEGRYEEDAA